MNFEQVQESTDFESMTFEQLQADPIAGKILEVQALEYLKEQDKEYFEREFRGDVNEDGYLIGKEGEILTKPSQNIGDAGLAEVLEKTKKELLNNSDLTQ